MGRDIIEPIILEEKRITKGDNIATINDAIEDIENAMGWEAFAK
ncbi:hypothetical protein [Anaerosporobacter sp.]|nr:hypothetical protein [Anaerosporobacter sp.]